MAKELPSEEQIIAILRDEPMVGSQLRSALGLPKKQKMAFKQLLADMIERGVLKRSAHKEYQLGDGEPLEDKREKRRKKLAEQGVEDNRRPGARSRRQTEKDSGTRVKRGILHQTGDEYRQGVRDVPPQAGAGQGRRDHQLHALSAPEAQA